MNWRYAVGLGLALFGVGLTAPAIGQKPALAMLDQLEKGRWELKIRGEGTPPQRMCLGDGRRMIQLRHPTIGCDRLVVLDSDSEVTVQYTCKGSGYGRTHIRRETPRLVQIDTQGIADGLPFAFTAEARKVGDCTS